jgi:hypothetical protein
MTTQSPEDASDASLVDPESLRDRPDVTVHDDIDVVDEETLDIVADLDDMAIVGLTNDDGEVLMMEITDTCDLKLPSASVAPDEDFAAAAREWVESQAGLTIDLDAPTAAWRIELSSEDGDRTAERHFVTYDATLASGERPSDVDDRPDDGAEFADWFDEMPDRAAEAPGSPQFFD